MPIAILVFSFNKDGVTRSENNDSKPAGFRYKAKVEHVNTPSPIHKIKDIQIVRKGEHFCLRVNSE